MIGKKTIESPSNNSISFLPDKILLISTSIFVLSKRTKLVPVKKMADPRDIANYIYHISSNENQFITGQVINITGGE